jgi:hypothetical protein
VEGAVSALLWFSESRGLQTALYWALLQDEIVVPRDAPPR